MSFQTEPQKCPCCLSKMSNDYAGRFARKQNDLIVYYCRNDLCDSIVEFKFHPNYYVLGSLIIRMNTILKYQEHYYHVHFSYTGDDVRSESGTCYINALEGCDQDGWRPNIVMSFPHDFIDDVYVDSFKLLNRALTLTLYK